MAMTFLRPLLVDLFRKTMKPVEQVLKDANVKEEAVNEVVLVGRSTRIQPQGPTALERIFWWQKSLLRVSIQMKLLHMVLLFKVGFFRGHKATKALSLSMFVP